MWDDDNVFRISFHDFESILGRQLTEDERIFVQNRFDINDWAEHVDIFIEFYNLKGVE